jgi:Ala-tRNA(Pro) deacylase
VHRTTAFELRLVISNFGGTVMKITELLTDRGIRFEHMHHRPAYTAQRVAEELHVPGREVAKPVLLRTAEGYIMAVVPATHRIDLERLREMLNEAYIDVASEAEMDRLFPDCEPGAMTPFGSLYHVPTVVDDTLAEDDQIVFEAQSHEDAIRMSYRDYEAIEKPRHGRFVEVG